MKLFKPEDFNVVESCSKEDVAREANKLVTKRIKKVLKEAEGDWDFLIWLLKNYDKKD